MGGDLADDFPPCEVHCYTDKQQQETNYQHQLPTTWTHIGGSRQQQVPWCHHQRRPDLEEINTKDNETLGFVQWNLSECYIPSEWSLLPIQLWYVQDSSTPLQFGILTWQAMSTPWNNFSDELPDSPIGIIPSIPQDVWQTWFRALGGSIYPNLSKTLAFHYKPP